MHIHIVCSAGCFLDIAMPPAYAPTPPVSDMENTQPNQHSWENSKEMQHDHGSQEAYGEIWEDSKPVVDMSDDGQQCPNIPLYGDWYHHYADYLNKMGKLIVSNDRW